MTTLVNIRAALNGEIGVTTDADTTPWTTTVRNQAIKDGYAALWTAGVWKPATQSIATDTDEDAFALTAIRRLERVELLDTDGTVMALVPAIAQGDGSGGYELRLVRRIATGYTMRVRGWGAYKSQFTGDADTNDIPVEHERIPLLKAKAILYRAQLARFARYGTSQAVPPEMQVSTESLLGIIAAAEREWAEETRVLSGQRRRTGQTRRL